MILLTHQGVPRHQIAGQVGCTADTVAKWVSRFN
jgi:transposase